MHTKYIMTFTLQIIFFSPSLKPFLAAGGPPVSGSLHTTPSHYTRCVIMPKHTARDMHKRTVFHPTAGPFILQTCDRPLSPSHSSVLECV